MGFVMEEDVGKIKLVIKNKFVYCNSPSTVSPLTEK